MLSKSQHAHSVQSILILCCIYFIHLVPASRAPARPAKQILSGQVARPSKLLYKDQLGTLNGMAAGWGFTWYFS